MTALRWALGGVPEPLGDLPGGDVYSGAQGISADATVVVGYSGSALGVEAFRWTAETGMVGLGGLEEGDFQSMAYGVSANGSLVVGVSGRTLTDPETTVEAFRWTADGGMVGLGYLRPTDYRSRAFDVSADGSVIVGGSGTEAFRWTLEGGMQGLGFLSGASATSYALAVSADGAVAVGYAAADGDWPLFAFIWDVDHGMRDLRAVLVEDYGLDIAEWDLRVAFDISADGRTIVGWGRNPAGQDEDWVVTIPEPATLALVAAGGLLLLRRRGA